MFIDLLSLVWHIPLFIKTNRFPIPKSCHLRKPTNPNTKQEKDKMHQLNQDSNPIPCQYQQHALPIEYRTGAQVDPTTGDTLDLRYTFSYKIQDYSPGYCQHQHKMICELELYSHLQSRGLEHRWILLLEGYSTDLKQTFYRLYMQVHNKQIQILIHVIKLHYTYILIQKFTSLK